MKSLIKTLPLTQEAVWTAKALFRRDAGPFNGRWRRLRQWLRELERHRSKSVEPDRHVIAFASTPMYIDCLLAIAVVLAARRCRVTVVWLPYIDSSSTEASARYERWSARSEVPVHDLVRLVDLRSIALGTDSAAYRKIAEDVADLDSCYERGKEVCDYQSDPEDLRCFQFRRDRNLDALRRLDTLLATERFDSGLTGNGLVLEMGCFAQLLTKRGIPYVSVDTFDASSSITAAQNRPACSWNTDLLWANDEPHALTSERRERAMTLLKAREHRSSDSRPTFQLFDPSGSERALSRLKLDPKRPIALVCTNLAWDSAVLRTGRTFATMHEWYVKTIRWFAERPHWQMVLRTHPVEHLVQGRLTVSDHICREFPELPQNVRLVRPADDLNTYDLMGAATTCICFTSTVGIEMAARGICPIVVGNVHYGNKGFTIDPETESDYFAALEAATDGRIGRCSPRQIELALCYMEAFNRDFPKPFPWRIWDVPKDEISKPVVDFVRGDCEQKYLDTFDFLANRASSRV